MPWARVSGFPPRRTFGWVARATLLILVGLWLFSQWYGVRYDPKGYQVLLLNGRVDVIVGGSAGPSGWTIQPATFEAWIEYLGEVDPLWWAPSLPDITRWPYGIVSVSLPLWMLIVPLAYATLVHARLRRYRRRKRGLCEHCGYDLTGNVSGTCPECGVATEHR